MIQRVISRFIIIALFSIAFAYIESAVVVYLREIFHPNGFNFPLTVFGIENFSAKLFLTEVGREAATLIVILTVSSLFGENRRQRVAYFMTIFALWDIFFYVWLKVLIDWPASLTDWDILFLIPVTWASPVLAPILICITMLLFALTILLLDMRNIHIKPRLFDWIGFAAAVLLTVSLFCHAGRFVAKADYYTHFNWLAFAAAELIAICFFAGCAVRAVLRKNINKSIC